MLIALVAAYFFMGGGGVSYFGERIDGIEKLIKSTIADTVRREEALRQIEVIEEATQTVNESIDVAAESLKAVHADYGSTADSYHEVLDGLEADLDLFFEQSLDARKGLKRALTREEWAEVFSSTENAE